MRGKVAKRLRKAAGYEKITTVKVIGDYNVTIGSGANLQVINVKRTEPNELTEEQKETKLKYKEFKKEYKSK